VLWLLVLSIRLPERVAQGSVRAWSVRGAASRQQLRGQNTGVVPLGAARINDGVLPTSINDGGNSEEAQVQGDVRAWSVRGAAARDQLRGRNHGAASFTGGVLPTKPVYTAMTSNTEEAQVQGDVLARSGVSLGAARITEGVLPTKGVSGNSEEAHVQGHVRAWSVRGAAARNQLRGGQHTSAGVSLLGAAHASGAALGEPTRDSEQAHVQGAVRAWSVRGAAARKQLREQSAGN